MNCNICSLYICVEDMDRAIKFYEEFFEQPVTERDNLYSVFEINEFRFGLFAYRVANEKHIWGSNCLPSISVDNIETLNLKIKGKEILLEPGRINHSESNRNSQFGAKRKSQCTSFSFL